MIPKLRNVLVASGVVAALAVATTASAQSGDGPTKLVVNAESSLAALALDNAGYAVPATGHDLDGGGTAAVTVNTATGQVCVSVTPALLDPITGLQISEGATGAAGTVRLDLGVVTPGTNAKCASTTPAQASLIVATPAAFYLNVITATFPTGAVRDQLAVSVPADPSAVHLLTEPARAYDSRSTTKLGGNEARTVNLTGTASGGSSGVPIGARAAIVTLTVTQTVDGGYLSMFSNALVGIPATSTVNWTATGQDVAATTTVALDGSGSVKVMAGPNGTHFIVDVIGYYPAATPT